MIQKNIPVELLCLIFELAYGYKFITDPLRDVDVQINIRESIPPCFLMSNLPPNGWVVCEKHDWEKPGVFSCTTCVRKFECVLIPSPFKRGNPYYPVDALDPTFPKWSPSVGAFLGLLSSNACQQNHTYKKCVLRKAFKMTNDSILRWNVYYETLFSKDFLLDSSNYFTEAYPWASDFISTVIEQLKGAQFLPFCSHKPV